MYDSIDDLPFVCRINLPPSALHLYREEFNRAWHESGAGRGRYRAAQAEAWLAVRRNFHRDPESHRWVPRLSALDSQPRKHAAAAPALIALVATAP